MIPASKSDKKLIIELLEESFIANSTMLSYSRIVNGKHRIKPFLEYVYHYSNARNGIFLSDNRSCVAFYFRAKKTFNPIVFFYFLKLMFTGIRFSKIVAICKHIRQIKSEKPKNKTYYHFWFLGANKNSCLKSTQLFIKELMSLAESDKLPVYAETTGIKNKYVYTRYGFDTYKTIYTSDLELTAYLMIKNYSMSA